MLSSFTACDMQAVLPCCQAHVSNTGIVMSAAFTARFKSDYNLFGKNVGALPSHKLLVQRMSWHTKYCKEALAGQKCRHSAACADPFGRARWPNRIASGWLPSGFKGTTVLWQWLEPTNTLLRTASRTHRTCGCSLHIHITSFTVSDRSNNSYDDDNNAHTVSVLGVDPTRPCSVNCGA